MAIEVRASNGRRADSFLEVLKYWGPLAVWLIALFAYSSDAASARQSGRMLAAIVRAIYADASEPLIVFLNAAARKSVHVVTYAALALLAYRALRRGRPDRWLTVWAFQALFITTMYALLDELLQVFTSGRTGTISDVITDVLGASAALLVLAHLRRSR